MYGISLGTIADICCGKLINCVNPNEEPGRIVIDSREASSGDLFAAFVGDNVDGHAYISSALKRGAVCALAERLPEEVSGPVILVKSVEDAVAVIASHFRKMLDIPVIGITGSNGKTTAKEMISAVLSERYNVLKTDKNLNNQIGVPMTVSSINSEHTAAVVEMGVSKKHDMELLGSIVRPDIVVYTNIGHAHLEFLDNLDGVLYEKGKAINYMNNEATVIINGDDEHLKKLQCRQRVISYGLTPGCDVRADEIEYCPDSNSISITIHVNGISIKAKVPSFGLHMVYAALEATAAALAVGIDAETAAGGIEKYKTVGRRSLLCKTEYLTLIDDSYNSNPDSLRNNIDSMFLLPGRHVCILGDMLELGEDSRYLHRSCGAYAAEKGVELVIGIGELGKEYAEGAGDKGLYFKSKDELIGSLTTVLRKNDVVLVKASRGMHLESVSEAIKAI